MKGFTLVETLIAIGIFMIIAIGIYFSYTNLLDIFSASYLNLTALSALDNELEIIKNMPYTDIGIQGGVPSGVLLSQKNIIYGNLPLVVNTVVRNIDDPFDGLQGGSPDDTAPADYKLVEIEITCPVCPKFIAPKITTTIAPIGLETVTNNGTLIIKAFDASGLPVSSADVLVVNNNVNPAINLNDVTDSGGILKLIDIPPSSGDYAITVSKAGYSSDRTYALGDPLNPNPLKQHATVISQQSTEISFIIDKVSTLNMRTQNKFCSGIGSVDFLQTGQKKIGTNPDVFKYSVADSTNTSGDRLITNLEFDTYDFKNQDGTYEVSGYGPLTPIVVDPDGAYSLTWLMEPLNSSAIIVTVLDNNSQTINDAKVTISKAGFSDQKYTGRKTALYTDWSGGQYNSKSTYMNTSIPGELQLGLIGGKYASMSDEWLVSQTIDFGTQSTNFYNLDMTFSQPAQTSVRVQLASNNDNATWNYIGPDGTASTHYTAGGTQIYSGHDGKRYIRYRVVLRTDDENMTPKLEDLTLNFHSTCIPDGQVYFSGLAQDTYTITIEKTGYQTYTDSAVIIDENREDYRATLISQ